MTPSNNIQIDSPWRNQALKLLRCELDEMSIDVMIEPEYLTVRPAHRVLNRQSELSCVFFFERDYHSNRAACFSASESTFGHMSERIFDALRFFTVPKWHEKNRGGDKERESEGGGAENQPL